MSRGGDNLQHRVLRIKIMFSFYVQIMFNHVKCKKYIFRIRHGYVRDPCTSRYPCARCLNSSIPPRYMFVHAFSTLNESWFRTVQGGSEKMPQITMAHNFEPPIMVNFSTFFVVPLFVSGIGFLLPLVYLERLLVHIESKILKPLETSYRFSTKPWPIRLKNWLGLTSNDPYQVNDHTILLFNYLASLLDKCILFWDIGYGMITYLFRPVIGWTCQFCPVWIGWLSSDCLWRCSTCHPMSVWIQNPNSVGLLRTLWIWEMPSGENQGHINGPKYQLLHGPKQNKADYRRIMRWQQFLQFFIG